MNISNLLGRFIVGTTITSGIAEKIESLMVDYDKEIYHPIDSISIIMPSYNEERYVGYATRSVRDNIENIKNNLNNQNSLGLEYKNKLDYQDKFEFILVDSGSTDNTVKIAEKYVDKVISVPIRGKLTARNLATDLSKGNIIVSTDADTYYPQGWLNSLLRPFNDINFSRQKIIAVNGSTYDYDIPWIPGTWHSIGNYVDRNIFHPDQMVGRNSAYFKHDSYLVGRFNENINQLDVTQMLNEEEKGFGNRLAKLGKIVFKLNAGCIHLGGKRIGCRLGTGNRNMCDNYKIGIERFG